MEQAQTKLNEWEVIKEQIERSKTLRINWKQIFHVSLTKVIAECYAHNLNASQTYEFLSQKLEQKGLAHDILLKNLKIGVCARYGEIRSESKQIAKTLHELENADTLKKIFEGGG